MAKSQVEYETFKLYNGEIEILYNDNQHSYWMKVDGKMKRLCGVTTYLGMIDKSAALIPWAVRTTIEYIRKNIDRIQEDPKQLLEEAKKEAENQKDQAAELGKAIHLWISEHIKGNEPEMPEDDRVTQGVMSFIDWVNKHNVKFTDSERVIYSKDHGFVGTLDMVVIIDGKKYLGDIKTGNAIYDEAKAQTAAYLYAYQEETGEDIDGRFILRISKETEEEYKSRMAERGKTDYPEYMLFEPVFLKNNIDDQFNDFSAFTAAKTIYKWKNSK